MEPVEFLRVLRRRWRVLVAGALLGLTVSLFVSPSSNAQPRKHRQFKAQAVLLANAVRHVDTATLSQDELLLRIGVVPARAVQQLKTTASPAHLVNQITTTIDQKVGTITVAAVQPSSTGAVALVNVFTEQLVQYLKELFKATYDQNVKSALDRTNQLSDQLAVVDRKVLADPTNRTLQAQKSGLSTAFDFSSRTYAKIVSAGVPAAPFHLVEATTATAVAKKASVTSIGNAETRGVLAALIGLILGAGIAMLLDRFDLRVRTKEDAEEAFGLPVVSEIPAMWYPMRRRREVLTVVQPISPYAEVHRILRHSLLFAHMRPFNANGLGENGNGANGNGNGAARNGRARQVIVVTSAGSAEGKTTTVANLAASFAESGQSVLVMSCDFHGPRIQEMLGAVDAPGIANVLHGGVNAPTLAEVTVETSIPGVWLAPSGDGIDNPPELASSVGPLMDAARKLADVVIIDTPALLSVSAASELLPAADVSVIVARSSRTTREAAARVHERLGLLDANVLGVVLVGPQIPSVSREYSGYSRPEGGWRKRRRLLKKREIQIGARAEQLGRTREVPAATGPKAAAAVAPVVDIASAPTPAPTPTRPVSAPPVATAPAPAPTPPVTATPVATAPAPAPTPPVTAAPVATPPAPAPARDLFADPPVSVAPQPQPQVQSPNPPAPEPEYRDDLSPRPRWRRRDLRRDE